MEKKIGGYFMLETPMGKLIIQKNSMDIDYRIIPQPLKVMDGCDYYVDARYLILIDTMAIKAGDIVKCFIECQNTETDIDGGEYLSLLNFRKDNILLSLGAFEIQYHLYDDKNVAFEITYIKDGLEAYFVDTQDVEKFRFAISWIDLKEEDRDEDEAATWYGSDPLLCNP